MLAFDNDRRFQVTYTDAAECTTIKDVCCATSRNRPVWSPAMLEARRIS